jgi:hypothetical protein
MGVERGELLAARAGRIAGALPSLRASSQMYVEMTRWRAAAIAASNLSESELLVGAVAGWGFSIRSSGKLARREEVVQLI